MRYREFQLGSDVASIAKLIGTGVFGCQAGPSASSGDAESRMAPAIFLERRLAPNRSGRVDCVQVLRRSAFPSGCRLRPRQNRRHDPRRHDRSDHGGVRTSLTNICLSRKVRRRWTMERLMRLSLSGETKSRQSHCCASPIRYRSDSLLPSRASTILHEPQVLKPFASTPRKRRSARSRVKRKNRTMPLPRWKKRRSKTRRSSGRDDRHRPGRRCRIPLWFSRWFHREEGMGSVSAQWLAEYRQNHEG